MRRTLACESGVMMHWVKKHKGVLAVCDEELIGRKFDVLDVNENFYKGELIDEKRLSELLKDNSNINIVGTRSIKAAEKAGVLCAVKKIKSVPYAIIFKI